MRLLLSRNHSKTEASCSSAGSRTMYTSVLDWACQSENIHSAATMAALDLLKTIFEVGQCSRSYALPISSLMSRLLPCLCTEKVTASSFAYVSIRIVAWDDKFLYATILSVKFVTRMCIA